MLITSEQAAAIRQYVEKFSSPMISDTQTIKTAMLGQYMVGKSKIVSRHKFNRSEPDGFDPTSFEVPYFRMQTEIEGKPIKFDGESNFGDAGKSPTDGEHYFRMVRHCEVCVFVYDVTNRSSFEELRGYYQNFYIERSLDGSRDSYPAPSDPPRGRFRGLFFVIANRIDSDVHDWTVSPQEGEDFSAAIGAVFLQMAPKTGEGMGPEVLADIARLVLLRRFQNKCEHEAETQTKAQETAEQGKARPLDSVLQAPFWSEMRQLRDNLRRRRILDLDNYATVQTRQNTLDQLEE